jgi:putative alpha-1,2-mannosidase
MLNGQPMTSAIFHHADIAKGGAIEVTMGTTASHWGQ